MSPAVNYFVSPTTLSFKVGNWDDNVPTLNYLTLAESKCLIHASVLWFIEYIKYIKYMYIYIYYILCINCHISLGAPLRSFQAQLLSSGIVEHLLQPTHPAPIAP